MDDEPHVWVYVAAAVIVIIIYLLLSGEAAANAWGALGVLG